MKKKIADLLYTRIGVGVNLDELSDNEDAQLAVASLLALVANSDGSVSSDEAVKIVDLLRERFGIRNTLALDLLVRSTDRLADARGLSVLFSELNKELRLSQKEEVLSMVLELIAADGRKEAGEMKILSTTISALEIPEAAVEKAFDTYFSSKAG